MTDISENTHLATLRNPSFLMSLYQSIESYFKRQKQYRVNRAAFLNLLEKDDRTLADIGIDRTDVENAARLPLNQNAAKALDQLKYNRRA